MSKTKQKSLEELLEEALVPEDEQPYEVPGNWVWVRLGNYLENHNGARVPVSAKDREKMKGNIPYYGASGVIDYVNDWTHNGKFVLIAEDGANLISRSKPISFLTEGKIWVNNHAHILKGKCGTPEEYVCYYINSISLHNYVTGTAQPKLTQKNLNKIPIPVAPLDEQKRIVDKIERLFAKIDEAKRLIEEVKESIELRRAAILERAFRGELGTNDPFEAPSQINEKEIVPPNEQPYKVPENWVWVRLGAIFEQEKKQIQPTGTEKYIGLEHLISGGGIAEIGDTQELRSKKVVFKKGDVLYGKLRPYLNKHAIADFDGVASTDIIVFRNPSLILNKLLDTFLGSSYVMKYANEHSKGINLPRVSPKLMDNLSFPLPPADEQKRIVEKVSYLLSNLEDERQLVSIVAEMLDLLKQSILSKAFRGELGTNDPSDEHAIELLKEVLKSK